MLSLLSFALSMTKEQLYAYGEREIDAPTMEAIDGFMEERKAGKPIAYIVGTKEFYSDLFSVNASVLIPRPETEELVDEALASVPRKADVRSVLDMGTGSGVIGILLAKHLPSATIDCVDCSRNALETARRNASFHGVAGRTRFLCADLFGALKETQKYDLIVANLPYVPLKEWNLLERDVKEFEPPGALKGGDDGLDIYRRFLADIADHVNPGGKVACETAGRFQSDVVRKELEKRGFCVTIKKDLSHKERIVVGSWTNWL